MAKKVVLAFVCLSVILVGLGAAGFRVERAGSGWPRFIVRSNESVLEADRAQHKDATDTSGATGATGAIGTTGATGATGASGGAPGAPVAPIAPIAPVSSASSWSDFRGPNRDGRYTAGPIRTNWPREGLPRLWKQPVGGGYASFVVADGRAFTIEQRRDQEVVAAYDVKTGRELWTNAWNASFEESMGGDGPRATPTYHDGHVYALGAEGELRVLDAAKGTVVWRRNILSDNGASNVSWGMSASPLIVDDKVVVLPGGTRGNSIVAYNKATGDPVWQSLNDEASYTSPMLVTLGGVPQILAVTATRVVGLTAETGALLWEYPWSTFNGINVAQPIVFTHNGRDRIFMSASYGHGAAVFELTPSSAAEGRAHRLQATTVWENERMKNKFTSSVLHKGHIYGLDESILASVNAETGELNWKGGRYGYGQLVLAGDHLVVLTEDGDVVLVNATPSRHEEVARFPAIEGKTWNHPVIADGKLLVRNIQEMAAFDIR